MIGEIRSILEEKLDLSEYFGNDCDLKTELDIYTQGVSNGFLSEILCAVTGYQLEVCGEVEELYPCPCCGLRTLTERHDQDEGTGYDICPYCKWEDDGTTDVKSIRSINHGSMEEYRSRIRTNINKYYIDKWFKG